MNKAKLPTFEARADHWLLNRYNLVALIIAGTLTVTNFFLNPAREAAEAAKETATQLQTHIQLEMQASSERDAKLIDLSARIQNIKDNDLHTIEGKTEQNRVSIDNLANEVTKLQTIIDERIPKKK